MCRSYLETTCQLHGHYMGTELHDDEYIMGWELHSEQRVALGTSYGYESPPGNVQITGVLKVTRRPQHIQQSNQCKINGRRKAHYTDLVKYQSHACFRTNNICLQHTNTRRTFS